MRPNISKPKPEPTLQVQDDSEDEQDGVAETQVTGDVPNDVNSDSDSDSSEYESDASHTPRKRGVPKKKPEEAKDAAKEGVVKTAARKIKATAHANYRRLKIKGKGATAGKGKFGRRR